MHAHARTIDAKHDFTGGVRLAAMITLPVHPALRTLQATTPAGIPRAAAIDESSLKYSCPRRTKFAVLTAVLISAGIHTGLLFGLRPLPRPARKAVAEEKPVIALSIPQLKDLEEPEPEPNRDDAGAKPDLGSPAPMLADIPQIPTPTDFVQPIDFSTLVDRPDFSQTKIFVIPEHISRSGRSATGNGGDIFNLADLDRIPEVIFQPSPIFPQSQKQYVTAASVSVLFIVTTEGRVDDIIVEQSTHSGFEEAATTAVKQWRFRPGLKGGRKVNTRMVVPINFKIVD